MCGFLLCLKLLVFVCNHLNLNQVASLVIYSDEILNMNLLLLATTCFCFCEGQFNFPALMK